MEMSNLIYIIVHVLLGLADSVNESGRAGEDEGYSMTSNKQKSSYTSKR